MRGKILDITKIKRGERIRSNTLLLVFLMALIIPVQVLAQEDENSEGRFDRIWTISIEGNKSYEDVVIEQFIANDAPNLWQKITFFRQKRFYMSETEIRRDVIRIQRFYNVRGFNDVEVGYRIESRKKTWRKDLIFTVKENYPIRIDSVEIHINASKQDSLSMSESSSFRSAVRKLPYRRGRIYEPVEEQEVLGRLNEGLRNLGYPYAESSLTAVVDTAAKLADVSITTTPGPRARFDSVEIEGEATLDDFYIRRETGIKKGEYFSDRKLRAAQREVYKHHLMRLALVSIPEQPRDSTIDILIRVKELPLRSVQLQGGIGGFDRLHERVSKYNFYKLFRFQAGWIYRNVAGRGEQFSVNTRLSWFEASLSTEYLFPYVFNTKSSVNINPYAQIRAEDNYSIRSLGLINTFGYEYNRNLTGTFSYEFAVNDEFDVKTDQYTNGGLPDSVLSYNISSFRFNFYYAKGLGADGDGFTIQPYWELSGLFGESTYSFQKLAIDLRQFRNLVGDLVFATRVNAGVMYYSKQDSLPKDVRFYTGGTSSVRGWARKQLGPKKPLFDEDGNFERYSGIGGNAMINFNVELRQGIDPLLKGVGFAVFLDGGQVFSNLTSIGQSELQYGVGAGIRYKSPIGPIRFDVAYKVNPTEEDLNIYQGVDYGGRWARWGFHLSIGQAF